MTPNTPILKLMHISSWKTYQLLIPRGTRYRGLLPKALTVGSSRWSASDPTLGRVKVRHPNYCSHFPDQKKLIFQHENELQNRFTSWQMYCSKWRYRSDCERWLRHPPVADPWSEMERAQTWIKLFIKLHIFVTFKKT
jgi:hypothetical protein